MSTVELVFEVPKERAGCADWLKGESPMVTADALSLTESAYGLMKRSIVSKGYSNGSEEELVKQKSQFEEMIRNVEDGYKLKISKISNEYEREISKIKEMSEKNEEMLMGRLNSMKEYEKEIKADISTVYETQMNCYERTIKSNEERNKELQLMLKEKDVMYAKLVEEKQQISDEYVKRFENMNKLLTGTAANKGVVGENFVQDVFINSAMRIGYLEDTRYTNNVGCEDFLWKWTPSNGVDMICSVEVKNSDRLVTADITKHQKRIDEASNAGKINCGLFLSLKCKIQNTNTIEVKMLSGVPVLYVSKSENMSSTNVVEFGFTLMSLLWENTKISDVCSEDEDGINKLRDMSMKFVEMIRCQYEHLSLMNTQIQDLENSANSLLRQSQKMKKMRLGMLSNITTFQTSYPELFTKTEVEVEDIDSVDSKNEMENIMNMAEELGLIDVIKKFNVDRKKYPKKIEHVKNFFEDPSKYEKVASMKWISKFEEIAERVKKNKPRVKSLKSKGESSGVRSMTITLGSCSSDNGSNE